MVLFVAVKLKQIFYKQRDYPWPRPEPCPRCHEPRVWGHGFVAAYFDEYPCALLLRRYRCPVCGCVIRLRPKGYFKRFQASIRQIYGSLRQRIVNGRYEAGLSRSRQRHWMCALQRQVAAGLGEGFRGRLLEGFKLLVQGGRVSVAGRI
jgi:hypothetical protein